MKLLDNLTLFGIIRPRNLIKYFAEGDGGDGSDDGSGGSGGSGGGGGTGHWADGVSVDLRNLPAVQRAPDVSTFIKNYHNLETKIGQKGVLIPGANASEEEKTAFYEALGRPKSSDEYQLALPQEVHKGIESTPESQKFYKDLFHKYGLTSTQAQGIYNDFITDLSTMLKQQDEAEEKARNEAATTLRREWGNQYDAKLGMAQRIVNKFGGEKAKEFMDKGLGNDPAMIKMLAAIGDVLSEDVLGPGGKSGLGGMSPTEAQAKISEIMGNSKHAYWNDQDPLHDEAVKQMQDLYAIANPEQPPAV